MERPKPFPAREPKSRARLRLCLAAAIGFYATVAGAWDSDRHNPTHSTHSYLTEYAIAQLRRTCPELTQFKAQLIEGANTELHELPLSAQAYGLDLDALRRKHKGTNAGTDDISGWWKDSLTAYRSNQKQRAYFLLGVMLHMIEDMGAPAHANNVYHQASVREFDNFEFLALSNWPDAPRAATRA